MDIKEEILIGLKKPFCHYVEDLNKVINASNNDIRKALSDLILEDKVYQKNKSFYLKKQGIIEIKEKGFAFVRVEGEDDYFISDTDATNAFSGDKVSIAVLPKIGNQRLDSGFVVEILERNNENVYGKVIMKKNKLGIQYLVISYDAKFKFRATIKPENLNGAVEGNIVVAKILTYNGNKSEAKITRIVGHQDDPTADISLIALQYGFESEFNEEAMRQAINTPDSVNLADYKDRRDFTNDLVITIDGDDSKDFDDAINLKVLPTGNYLLAVHIADVSEYVKLNSPLDVEAYNRGTSVYLADRVIPMLPHKLSNGICSLNEGVNRLVLSCIMEIDNKGNLVNYEIVEGVIKSTHRMTYSKVNKILDLGDSDLIHDYNDIYPMLLGMRDLSKIIRDRRVKRGAIDFEVPEYKIGLNEEGMPISFELRTRETGELLIEDFMLMANETVAYHMSISNLPCLYRVHENPDQEKLEKVFSFINYLGFNVPKPKKILPKVIQTAMNEIKGKPEFYVVNQIMLRAMMKAKYDEKNLGHYGLAFQYYCHFTSPIRRYPDLMVHRLIKSLILHPRNFDVDLTFFNSIIHDVAYKCSIQERKSIECEREVDDMLMAMYMTDHIGETSEGIINSITSFGMFVSLPNGIEGLIHVSNMNGYFKFNEQTMSMSNGKTTYTVGDKVNIVVYESSKKDRRVEFVLQRDYLNFRGESK